MNKKCGINSDTLADYVYDEITDAAKRKELDEHIKTCAECGSEITKLELVKKAAGNANINFSPDIWEVHRKGVIRKLAKTEDVVQNIRQAVFSAFNVKVYALAALVLVMGGVGTQYYRAVKAAQDQKAIAERVELLQNIEIIERLDFYEKISKK